MKQYHEYVKEYPKCVIFVKKGSFYKVRGESAYIIHKLLGFQLYLSGDEFCTGCPVASMERIVLRIRENELNYVLVDKDSVDVFDEYELEHYDKFSDVFQQLEELKLQELNKKAAMDEDETYLYKVHDVLILLKENETISKYIVSNLPGYESDEVLDIIAHGCRLIEHAIHYGFSHKHRKMSIKPFSIQKDVAMQIISDQPVKVSEFTTSLNHLIQQEGMKKLIATQITNWLLERGYLEEELDEQNNRIRVVSKKGTELGITTEEHQGKRGIYRTNLYNADAQRFLIENLEFITG